MSLTQTPPPAEMEPIFFEGDVVECYVDLETKERGRFMVLKVNPVNVKLESEEGTTATINRRGILSRSDDQDWNRQTVVYKKGTVLRFTDDRGREDRQGDFVVINNTSDGRHELIRLGGDDASWRDVHSSSVEVVTGTVTIAG